MKRKKMEGETPESPGFWPVPGVDGEPYPPRVQDALDLIAEETKRLKIRECKHEGRFPSQVHPGWEGLHSRPYHVCACRDCGAERIACLTDWECDYSRRRTPNYGFEYERREEPQPRTDTAWLKTREQKQREARMDLMVARQIKRAAERMRPYEEGALRKSITPSPEELDRERVRQRNLARRAARDGLPNVITNPDQAPDLTWIRTMSGKRVLL